MSLKIAIIAQHNQAKYGEIHTTIDNAWFELLSNIECSIHIVPNHFDCAKKMLEAVKPDAFILTGGGNFTFDFDNDPRSKIESFILTHYTQRPILAVCRGMQAMHLVSGGALKKVHGHVQKHCSITFKDIKTSQNSYHDHGFSHCTEDYISLSKGDDGVIKAFQHKKYNWIGIMWHPERLNQDQKFNINLIEDLFFKVTQ